MQRESLYMLLFALLYSIRIKYWKNAWETKEDYIF